MTSAGQFIFRRTDVLGQLSAESAGSVGQERAALAMGQAVSSRHWSGPMMKQPHPGRLWIKQGIPSRTATRTSRTLTSRLDELLMPYASNNDVELYYETHGDPADPALLLVNGYSSQLVAWGQGYREAYAARGRFVISFDNRDVGLSTHLDGVEVDLAAITKAAMSGSPLPPVPYTLDDFAADAVAVLNHLGIERAHIAGSSMGGMIVQTIAINHPDRVLTLTSVMSTTGEPEYFQSAPAVASSLATAAVPTEREAYIADATKRSALACGKRYFDPVEIAAKFGLSYDRRFDPAGWTRQMAGIRASGPRADKLRQLKVPTLVIHGLEDGLILPKGGIRTAEIIPGANLLLLHDMGHDLPRPLWPLIMDAIMSHTTHAIG